ncbi:MAG: T9SS type A sorting domain-containing protein [Ignavibacteria bacterium]|nr:T9SS type A sorting domain-containing protein [Ignavibacteria bacterium]
MLFLLLLMPAAARGQQVTLSMQGVSSIEARSLHGVYISLLPPLPVPTVLPPFTCRLRFDSTFGKFLGVSISHGELLDSVPYTVQSNDSEIVFATGAAKAFAAEDGLFGLNFQASDPDTESVGTFRVVDWKFQGGAADPVWLRSETKVNVRPYRLFFSWCDDAQAAFTWNEATGTLRPDTLWLTSRAEDRRPADTARNVRFTVRYDSSALELLWPASLTQPSESTVLSRYGGAYRCRWAFRAKAGYRGVVTSITDSVSSDNFLPKICVRKVRIPPMPTTLTCEVDVPSLHYDTAAQRYAPSPLPIEIRVRNTGARRSDTVTVRIAIPDFAALRGLPGRLKDTVRIASVILQPGDSARVHWDVDIPSSSIARSGRVIVTAQTANAPDAAAEAMLSIPAAAYPAFDALCVYPETLRYHAGANAITPDTFTVTARFVNAGSAAARNGRATLLLPDFFSLRDSLEGTQPLLPALIAPGDTTGERRWRVRFTGNRRAPMPYRFAWRFDGVHPSGDRLTMQPVSCGGGIAQGYPPVLAITIDAPDTVFLAPQNVDSASLVVPVRCTVSNIGTEAQILRSISLPLAYRPTEDAVIDPATPMERFLNSALAPGDSVQFTWQLRISYRTPFESNRIIAELVTADGNRIESERFLAIRKRHAFTAALRHVSVHPPYVEVHISGTCDGIAVSTRDPSLFDIRDNGVRIQNLSLFGSGWNAWRIPVSVAFVMAAGSEQSETVRRIARDFIDQLDGTSDEAMIVTRDAARPVVLPFTSDRTALAAALPAALHPAGGGLIDAMMDGLRSLHEQARNATALVVFTDGTDDGSLHTVREFQEYMDVTMYRHPLSGLAMIKLGAPEYETSVEGIEWDVWPLWYYGDAPSAAYIVGQFRLGIGAEPPFTEILLPNPCSDGSVHDLTISMRSDCPGCDTTVRFTASYKSRYFPSEFRPLNLRLGYVASQSDTSVAVPLLLDTRVQNDSLRAAMFRIVYDTTIARFDSLSVLNCLLEGAIGEVRTDADTITITTRAKYFPLAEGYLAKLYFSTKPVADTVTSALRLIDWHFIHGCYTPALTGGKLLLYPRSPVASSEAETPARFALEQNHPNPCGGRTRIAYTLAKAGRARLSVLDLLGRRVATLSEGLQAAGSHSAELDAAGLPEGVYLYRLEAEGETVTRRMIVRR